MIQGPRSVRHCAPGGGRVVPGQPQQQDNGHKTARGKNCPAIGGIPEEGAGVMDTFSGDQALDAGSLAAQKVEHCGIASYGSMVAWAERLGMDDAAGLPRGPRKKRRRRMGSTRSFPGP